MVNVVAQGSKVLLRAKQPEDAADDYRWRTDSELATLDATVPLPMTFREFTRMFEDELRYPLPGVRRYAIETLDGVHIGNCMCYDIDTVRGEGEVGIMVGEREYWDGGYGTEALVFLVEECFRIPSLRRLYLHTLEWNARARRAFAKCGFREVRPVWRGGKNFIFMELLLEEWRAMRAERLAAAGVEPSSPPAGD